MQRDFMVMIIMIIIIVDNSNNNDYSSIAAATIQKFKLTLLVSPGRNDALLAFAVVDLRRDCSESVT